MAAVSYTVVVLPRAGQTTTDVGLLLCCVKHLARRRRYGPFKQVIGYRR